MKVYYKIIYLSKTSPHYWKNLYKKTFDLFHVHLRPQDSKPFWKFENIKSEIPDKLNSVQCNKRDCKTYSICTCPFRLKKVRGSWEAVEAAWFGLKADHRAASSYQRNQEYKGSKKGFQDSLGLITYFWLLICYSLKITKLNKVAK